MRLHRFYVTQPLGEEVVVNDVSLVKQWTKVFRYVVGDFVILFNGDGNDFCYCIQKVTNTSCELTCTSTTPSYIPKRITYLYLPLIKKDLFELVVEKATELGITDICPLVTSRTEKKSLPIERILKIAQEASEQSGRGDVLKLHKELEFTSLSKNLQENVVSRENTLVLTREGALVTTFLKERAARTVEPLAIILGPEGGWTEGEELFFKDEGYTRISLGDTVLRAETAAIAGSFLSTLV
jgi:16S rRNA (uracil1498-N3)-methyltransferase